MKFVESYTKKPHLLLSFIILFTIMGFVGFFKIPVTLFPDSERPQIAIVTVWPGAAADDVNNDISRVIEKEIKTIELIRRVVSTSNDEVSVVIGEFEYSKGLDSAATDVSNSLNKIRPFLPPDIRPFQVYKVSSATPAVLTIALYPKEGSNLDLSIIRQLADNEIKEELLRTKYVSNVEVFGGYQGVIKVIVDPDKLKSYNLNSNQIVNALNTFNRNTPLGLLVSDKTHILLKSEGEFKDLRDVENVVLLTSTGAPIYIKDVAKVERSYLERLSAFHGNGKEAIGINIQRSLSGYSLPTIKTVMKKLKEFETKYPLINFEVADTQGELIETAVSNMVDALRDAIIMTIIVIFLFLAELRGMILAGISIPFTYLITFAFMWIFGMEFNITTLTGVILGVGMLLDDAIVVLENIERHYHKLGKDLKSATIGGTKEVMLAILSGTYATVVVLLPIIYIGGYVQTVLRPLCLTLTIALISSYFVSITILPIAAPTILKLGGRSDRWKWEIKLDYVVNNKILHPIQEFFVKVLSYALKRKVYFILVAFALLVFTGKVIMPLIGKDLMPPMDTGIFRVTFESYPNTSLAESEKLLKKVEEIIKKEPYVTIFSSTLGSEPGVLSFGSGRNAQQAFITVHIVNRFKRKESMWKIEKNILNEIRKIPGIRYPAVYDYGATPLSTVRSTVDLMISGDDPKVLASIAKDVEERLQKVKGLTSVVKTWSFDRSEYRFKVNPEMLSIYGIDSAQIFAQASSFIKGYPATFFRNKNQDSFFVLVQSESHRRENLIELETIPIQTPKGTVYLSSLGKIEKTFVQTLHTRQDLKETVDVLGYRETGAVTHINREVSKALEGLKLPGGYTITDEGERKMIDENFALLKSALFLSFIFLYFSLIPAFKSFHHPLTIMIAIPLGVIGAGWAMLFMGKHQCQPSLMGMILLAGIVVKNSILLIDFIEEARNSGQSLRDALIGSVRVRTRPILMTAVGTSVGMVPIALEWAIGLEKLSPLAIVAIGGLMVSTFLTLIYVPLFYELFEKIIIKTKNLLK